MKGALAGVVPYLKAPAMFPTNRGYKEAGHNDDADAVRHAWWSAELTRRHGPQKAKEITDYHEAVNPNVSRERWMDLHNNSAGRQIGMPLIGQPASAVPAAVRQAWHEGKLATRPINDYGMGAQDPFGAKVQNGCKGRRK